MAEVNGKWKILIVDDEPIVHKVTKLVLKNLTFDGKNVEFISAYSAKEAKIVLKNTQDIALILLDVVMEEKDSGLQLVKFIREELNNSLMRIVIRTGHPGEAPEDKIILNYDINDYRDKTDVTSNKLFSTVISSLRSFRDMKTIITHNNGLNQIINSSSFIFGIHEREKFVESFCKDIVKLLNNFSFASSDELSVITVKPEEESYRIFYKYGVKFAHLNNGDVLDKSFEKYSEFDELYGKNMNIMDGKYFISLLSVKKEFNYIVYISSDRDFDDWSKNILELFFQNAKIAFENLSLNQEITETQRELILRLGEIIEHRSLETGFHVKRMAEFAYLLAKKYGLPEDSCDILRMASPMHDLGKVAIPDSILNKPEKLTDEEFEVMKTHTIIGYNVLKSSDRELLKKAAVIALEHHEKYDGTGYPEGKSGNDIHIFGRIAALADVFDALSNDRVYRKAWDLNDILQFIKDQSGKQFDPEIIEIFFSNLPDFLAIKEKYLD